MFLIYFFGYNFSFLRYVSCDPFGIKHTIRNVDDVEKHLTLVINEHEETFDEHNLRDYIDIYLKRIKSEKGKTESTFDCKFMVTMCMGFHILYTIRFCFVSILKYLKIQKRLDLQGSWMPKENL